jgi:enamine deaminase RidA (YjgF/YER057c/UK114 family)
MIPQARRLRARHAPRGNITDGLAMTDILRIDQNARRSRAVVHGGTVYLAGHVADDKTADFPEQMRQALANIDESLQRAGTDKSRLLTAQIWLRSMEDYEAMNAIWEEWVTPGQMPTRTCCQVWLADARLRVEVTVTAAI